MAAGEFQLGASQKEVDVVGFAALFVAQRAIELYAGDLSARVDLDQSSRRSLFDRFVKSLVDEAKNATVGNVSEADEAAGKATLCRIIGTFAQSLRETL